jgi:hypothetical protein
MEAVTRGFSDLAASRAAGLPVSAASYEEIMLACVETGRGMAVYRLMEEAAADGVRYGEFSQTARELLEGLLPPEAEALGDAGAGWGASADDALQDFVQMGGRVGCHRRLPIKHGHLSIKHGHSPINHRQSPINHGHFPSNSGDSHQRRPTGAG